MLWTNLKKTYGEEARRLVPESFVLPDELPELQRYQRQHNGQFYIFKPLDNSRGRGIYLFGGEETPQEEGLAQVYEELVLLDGFKFDLRVYVLVTNTDPLVAYVYDEGLARLASLRYEPPSDANKHSRTTHLTNAAINQEADAPVRLGEGLSTKLRMSEVFQRLTAKRFELFDPDIAPSITPEFLMRQLK